MWIYTNKGFISVIQSDKVKDEFCVRGRNKKQLRELFPGHKIVVLPMSDYCARIFIKKDEFQKTLSQLVQEIDYTNFKDSINDLDYHHACSKAWSAMLDYQLESEIDKKKANRGYKILVHGEKLCKHRF